MAGTQQIPAEELKQVLGYGSAKGHEVFTYTVLDVTDESGVRSDCNVCVRDRRV